MYANIVVSLYLTFVVCIFTFVFSGNKGFHLVPVLVFFSVPVYLFFCGAV